VLNNVTPKKILRPFQEFARLEAAGGILLLACTLIALIWANSSWSDSYTDVWRTQFTVQFSSFKIDKPILLWINDGLMAIFFFVVGLEIKREALVGDLNQFKRAILPISAALGGLILPALIYLAFNYQGTGEAGWGIPIATDIAFALGVMALLGSRVPTSLKIFLTALAIVDDILAVLIIALFYTAEISWSSLGIGFIILGALITTNLLGVRRPLIYGVLGLALWVAFLKSGVHATVAGVLLAMTVPARTALNPDGFLQRSRDYLDEFEHAADDGESVITNETRQAVIHHLEVIYERVQSPLQRLEHALHPWLVFLIMPLFALANAGVALGSESAANLTESVTLGIIFGLVIGKSTGISIASWLIVRSGLADKPSDVTWGHIYGASWLAGIGFTMSLFIAGLAFNDASLLPMAKIGILVASLIAGVVGATLLSRPGMSAKRDSETEE
jgi:NhaA family Na+:H+ antiporter